MSVYIRPYHPSDLTSLYRICLKTGDSGKDATQKYMDGDLIGHFYAAPYAVLEPDLTFILVNAGTPVGYILGTRHSHNFYHNCEQDWFPILREKYPLPQEEDLSPDAHLIRLIHKGHQVNADLDAYPAHLHIDILPAGQGKGMGRKLISVFTDKLKDLHVEGLHLQVGKKNQDAIRFYEKMNFYMIREYEHAIAFGMFLK